MHPSPPMLPDNRAMAALAYLIHNVGSEGLTKSAMYLRWNTSYANRLFARNEFQRTLRDLELTEFFAVSMRGYLPILGITLEHSTDVAVEESINAIYDTLNANFLKYPYILGGLPSLADYGFMGPLYAHHGRDIESSNKLKERAPALYRWIETMNRPPVVDPEVWVVAPEYFPIDALPDPLVDLLKLIAEHFLGEASATIDLYHQWLDADDRPAGTVVDIEGTKRCHQVLGMLEHLQMGTPIKRIGLLDDVSHHSRLQRVLGSMDEAEAEALDGVVKAIGADSFAGTRLKRDVKREDYAWVVV